MELASSLNGSNTSLLHSAPVLTLPYISVISLASVVGTLGNVLVIGSISGSVRRRNLRTVGKIFIVNLACSDLIVTSVINPVAVAGTSRDMPSLLRRCREIINTKISALRNSAYLERFVIRSVLGCNKPEGPRSNLSVPRRQECCS